MTRLLLGFTVLAVTALILGLNRSVASGTPQNVLLGDLEQARDTASVVYERITGEPADTDVDPLVNRSLRQPTLDADVPSLPAPE